jgi:hypothetical protein
MWLIGIRMDPHHFGKSYPDLYQSKKWDPDPRQRQNSRAVDTQNEAI